jgi:hypothetical protein
MNTTEQILEELDVLIEDSLRNSNPIGATLCDARSTIANYRTRIAEFWDALDALRSERDEARAENVGWQNKWQVAVEMAALAEYKLTAVTEERDRLTEAIVNHRAKAFPLTGEDFDQELWESLQSLTNQNEP